MPYAYDVIAYAIIRRFGVDRATKVVASAAKNDRRRRFLHAARIDVAMRHVTA